MKFLGTREVRFEEAKEAAAELYATITGDVEEVGFVSYFIVLSQLKYSCILIDIICMPRRTYSTKADNVKSFSTIFAFLY